MVPVPYKHGSEGLRWAGTSTVSYWAGSLGLVTGEAFSARKLTVPIRGVAQTIALYVEWTGNETRRCPVRVR